LRVLDNEARTLLEGFDECGQVVMRHVRIAPANRLPEVAEKEAQP
jgi:hypothetical protein